jgi:hypothetical protein
MHFGWSLEYQFVVASSREIISDLGKVTSSPLAQEMETL